MKPTVRAICAVRAEMLMMLLCLGLSALTAACSTSTGGGGGYYTVGGAAGTVCYPTTQNEGCFNNARVKCDPTTQQWTQLAACPSGQSCTTISDGAGKLVSQCTASGTPSGTPSGTTDAGSSKDTTVADVSLVKDGAGDAKADTTTGTKDGSTKPGCGDGICGVGETSDTCPADCNNTGAQCCAAKGAVCGFVPGCQASCGSCPTGKTCSKNQCVSGGGGGGGTDASSSDTGASGNCIEDKCGGEWQACLNDTGCIAVIKYIQVSACYQDNNCQDSACGQQFCSQELSQCQNDANCGAFAQCLQGCGQNDDACVNACVSETGGMTFTSLSDCADTNCPAP